MIDKMSEKYKSASKLIRSWRDKNFSWEKIMGCGDIGLSDDEKKDKLDALSDFNIIEPLTLDEWESVVEDEKDYEENVGPVVIIPPVMVPNKKDELYEIDTSYGSSWMAYKRKLISKKFSKETIDMIESSSFKILNKMKLDTENSLPVKGLVIGNVQSGKTANMAALMAMAADQGWNLFIVLSGTIENLRIQTQDRLIKDLNTADNVTWVPIDNVEIKKNFINSLDKLALNQENKQRYLMVCLKNSIRLKKLLTWLKQDLKSRNKLKILIIDDEADQASVNAGKDEQERKKPLFKKLFN